MGTIDSEYLNAKSPVESCHHGRLYIHGSHAQARPFQERKPQMKPITLLGTILMARQQSKLKNLMMTTSKWASSAKCRSSRAWEIIKKKTADSESKQEPASISMSLTCYLVFPAASNVACPRGTYCAISTNDFEQ